MINLSPVKCKRSSASVCVLPRTFIFSHVAEWVLEWNDSRPVALEATGKCWNRVVSVSFWMIAWSGVSYPGIPALDCLMVARLLLYSDWRLHFWVFLLQQFKFISSLTILSVLCIRGKISILAGGSLSPYFMPRILLSVKMWFCGKSSGLGHQISNHNSAARHSFLWVM